MLYCCLRKEKDTGLRMRISLFVLTAFLTVFVCGCASIGVVEKSQSENENSALEVPSETVSMQSATSVAPEKTPAPTVQATPAPTPVPTPSPVPTPEGMVVLKKGFSYMPVPDDVWRRMEGKSYPEGTDIPLDELVYVNVLHIGFDGQEKEGELVVNKKIADDILYIFAELYSAGYKIERMRLIDDYDAIDEASMTDNNTSCFCYRNIAGTSKLSYHARGLAIDINPLYNPYVSSKKIEPAAGAIYTDRSLANLYYIDEDDLCYKLFTERGFFWGGHYNSVKDYQHFEMRD